MPLFLRLTATAWLLAAATAWAGGMAALSEAELADVNAQQGVLLNLFLQNNVAGASNTPIGCTAAVPTPNPCRMGLSFPDNPDTWLMLKEFYGTFQIKDLRMDAGFMPAANTAYHDVNRFDGDTVAGCSATPLIPACNPAGMNAIKFSFPSSNDANPAVYDDFLSFLNIGRVWLEKDIVAGAPGYQQDTSLNSFLGVRMSDSRALNAPAQMRFVGTGYVYGF